MKAAKEVQVSAPVSPSTKDLLNRVTREFGLKKGFVMEQALLSYLQALHDLPPDLIVPPLVVLTEASGRAVMRRIRNPKPPTKALRDLMTRHGH